MVVFLGKIFTDMNDEELKLPNGNVATLRSIAIEGLLAVFQDESGLTGDEKLKRWELAMKVKNAVEPAEFTVEEVGLMKKLIGKAFSAIIVGQAWKMLEGK